MIDQELNLNTNPQYIRFVNKIQELMFNEVSPNELAGFNGTLILDDEGLPKEYRLFANIMKQMDDSEVSKELPKSRSIDKYNFLVFFIEDVDQMENIY